ncbi:MAG: glucosaminidase domain-containing protein [Bacteroidota bacterium]|nr:glucosaminidase domain-containing protein [Bacteroidota bacterium]
MQTSHHLKKKYLFIPLLLFVIGNGSFTYPGNSNTEAGNLIQAADKIPLFVQSDHPLFLEKYKLNPYFTRQLHTVKVAKENLHAIMRHGRCSVANMTGFLLYNNPVLDQELAARIAAHYYHESIVEGVNQDIAFTQMCLETGFLSFKGVVRPGQHNYCGLGAISDRHRGETFDSPEMGIRAHIQHLKAYASEQSLKNEIVDKRFRFVARGSAPYLQDLTGKWAADRHYDKKIQDLIHRLYQFSTSNYYTAL